MGALVESLHTFVLGGAGPVMFGMVAATGIRILAGVNYQRNTHNLFFNGGGKSSVAEAIAAAKAGEGGH
jgi:xanthine/uracil permease